MPLIDPFMLHIMAIQFQLSVLVIGLSWR